jgi:Uncharacterized conserved protein related to C-terminal domain of eukaryotic chaperone, SACSIN
VAAAKEIPQTSEEKLKSLKQKAGENFQNSFSRAAAFLKQAQFSKEQSNNNLTAFFLHQATELCCRALIASFLGIEKKTHSLHQLKKYSRRITPLVHQIFPENTTEEKRLLKLLDEAYLAARYENDFSITPDDLHILMEKVTQLHRSIFADVKQKLEDI